MVTAGHWPDEAAKGNLAWDRRRQEFVAPA